MSALPGTSPSRNLAACALALLVAAGCGNTKPCKDGTLMLEIELPGEAASADTLSVTVVVTGGDTVSGTVSHPAGATTGSVDVLFQNGYPAGKDASITLSARRGNSEIAAAKVVQTLAGACARVNLTTGALPSDGGQSLDASKDGPKVQSDAKGDVATATDVAAPQDGDGVPDADVTIDGPITLVDAPAQDAPAKDAPVTDGPPALADGRIPPPVDGGPCPGACLPGDKVACGKCGQRVCGADCAWGTCSGEGACAAGTSRGCGNCGVEFCNDKCTWSGVCGNQKACKPGDTRSCGNCGIETCTNACAWSGMCANDGACMPGTMQACGKCGQRACGANGGTCGWGACSGEGVCSPGESRACGNCGTQTCSNGCAWGTCLGQGTCAPGATGSCGNCGTTTCGNDCRWSASCTGQGVCSPGETTTCGLCDNGISTCSSLCRWGSCFGGTSNCCPTLDDPTALAPICVPQ